MKYIRIKDKIYEQTNIVKMAKALAKAEDYDYENIKEADTIEELCDEFVVVNDRPPKSKIIEKDLDKAYRWFYRCSIGKQDIAIFGSVWTSKGLIYVAKINEKGELELL